MGKDDHDPRARPKTPPTVVSPLRSPTWSPIPPLTKETPACSVQNENLLNSILIDTGIFSPRRQAMTPVVQDTWERSTSTTSATFSLPRDPVPGTSGTQQKREVKTKRAPRKTAGTTSKANHLIWIESEGLPNLMEKLDQAKLELSSTIQEITDLDMQMRAVKLMKTREEFKAACKVHVDVKLQLSVKRAKIRKEIQKLQSSKNDASDPANPGPGTRENWRN